MVGFCFTGSQVEKIPVSWRSLSAHALPLGPSFYLSFQLQIHNSCLMCLLQNGRFFFWYVHILILLVLAERMTLDRHKLKSMKPEAGILVCFLKFCICLEGNIHQTENKCLGTGPVGHQISSPLSGEQLIIWQIWETPLASLFGWQRVLSNF